MGQFSSAAFWAARKILIIKLLASASAYIFVLLLARTLDEAGFGLVAMALNIAFVLSVAGARGAHIGLVRCLPNLSQAEDVGALVTAAAQRTAFTTLSLAAVFLAAGVAIMFWGRPTSFSSDWFIATSLLIVTVGAADFLAAVARGHEAHMLSLLPKEVVWRLALILVLGFGMVPSTATPGTMIAIAALLLLVLCLIQADLIWQRLGPCPALSPPQKLYWGPYWVISVSNIILANLDTIIVGLVLGPVAAGPYFVANRLALALGHFQASHILALAPRIARLSSMQMAVEVVPASRAAARNTLFAGLALLISAGPLLGLFGTSIDAVNSVLVWLVLAAIINAATGPGDVILSMVGRERAAMALGLMTIAATCLLLPLGAFWAGGPGVAAAVAVVTSLRKGAALVLVQRHLGFRPDALAPLDMRIALPVAPLR